MKKMEKSIMKKMAKKLEKAFRETRKMITEIAPIRDKYKRMIVNMDHIKDDILWNAWDHLQGIGSKKNAFGQYIVPCHFHESFSGNFFLCSSRSISTAWSQMMPSTSRFAIG
jgi:hypothetical protein